MSISGNDNENKNQGRRNGPAQQSETTMAQGFRSARQNQEEQVSQDFGNSGFNNQVDDDNTWEFLNPSANGLFTVSDTAAGEHLSRLDKELKEIYKTANPATTISLLPLSMDNNNQLLIDTLVVIVGLANAPQLGVAYHPILLAGSIPQLEDVTTQVQRPGGMGTMNVLETRVEGDIADEVYYGIIKDEVEKNFPGVPTFPVIGETLPRNFNFEDQDALQKGARNASMAGAVTLQNHVSSRSDLNLANVKKNSKLTLRTNFGQANELDRVGLPVRSDIVVALTAEPIVPKSEQKRIMSTRSSQVARVQAFVDLVWSPSMEETNPFFQLPQQQGFGNQRPVNPHEKYIPRIVVTGLSTNNPPTTAVQLLNWLLSMNISENGQWVHAFTPRNYRTGSKDYDMHDIGAMAIEANFENNPDGLGMRVDTTLETFQAKLPSYLAAIIRPEPVISIDISECGADSWINGFLAKAAEEDEEALDLVFNAANTLTNGHFAKNWENVDYNGPIFSDENNRIHAGYYLDSEGKQRDIREIDYLAVLNRFGGGTEHEIVRRWSESFLDEAGPLLARLEDRRKVIDLMTGNSAKYTGFFRRVSAAHVFMEVLAKSAKQAGLAFDTVNSQAALKTNTRLGGNFGAFAFGQGQSSGLFNRGRGGDTGGGNSFGSNRRFGF